jgi:hypothetical protein
LAAAKKPEDRTGKKILKRESKKKENKRRLQRRSLKE